MNGIKLRKYSLAYKNQADFIYNISPSRAKRKRRNKNKATESQGQTKKIEDLKENVSFITRKIIGKITILLKSTISLLNLNFVKFACRIMFSDRFC